MYLNYSMYLALLTDPLPTSKRDELIFNWYLNLATVNHGKTRTKKQIDRLAKAQQYDLLKHINSVSSLEVISRNQSLLPLLIEAYETKSYFPVTLVGIYKQICEVLIDSGCSYLLKPEQRQAILQAIALEMAKHQVFHFTLDEECQDSNILLVKDFVRLELGQMIEIDATVNLEDIIENNDLGINNFLSSREQKYGFLHPTLQQYLASIELTKPENEHYVLKAFNKNKQYLDWWKQSILFYAGQTKIDKLIDAVLDNPNEENLILAYHCLLNKLKVSPTKEQELLTEIKQFSGNILL